MLPGGSRAECDAFSLRQAEGESCVNHLWLTSPNRLSDHLFVWARLAYDGERADLLW